MKGTNQKPGAPLKFNPAWLKGSSYNNLVKSIWRPFDQSQVLSFSHPFMKNLKIMKKEIVDWAKGKKLKDEAELTRIGEELDFLEGPEADSYETKEKQENIKKLESRRRRILFDIE